MVPQLQSPPRRVLLAVLVFVAAFVGVAGVATAQSASASLTTMNDTVRVHAETNATVHGTANLSEGAEVTVRLQSAGETQPRKIATESVTVGADGRFAATFDLSVYSPGDRFTVSVIHDERELASSSVRVVDESMAVTPAGESSRPIPGFGVILTVLALAVVGVLHRRTRR